MTRRPGWTTEFKAALMADSNVYAWADRLAPAHATSDLPSPPPLPPLGFDCGTADELLAQNQRFFAYMQKIGLTCNYAEHPGGHTWTYWDTHIRTALQQHCAVLQLPYTETV